MSRKSQMLWVQMVVPHVMSSDVTSNVSEYDRRQRRHLEKLGNQRQGTASATKDFSQSHWADQARAALKEHDQRLLQICQDLGPNMTYPQ